MFECHLTYEDVGIDLEEKLEAYAKANGWSTSFIVGDPTTGPGRKFFLTAHGRDYRDLYEKMQKAVEESPTVVLRQQIGHIVYDTKYKILYGYVK